MPCHYAPDSLAPAAFSHARISWAEWGRRGWVSRTHHSWRTFPLTGIQLGCAVCSSLSMEDTDRRAEGAVGMTTTMVQPAEAASTGKQENAATAAVQGGGEETVLCGDCGKRCAAHADGAAGGRIDEADGLFYCNVCWASYEQGGAHGSGVGCNGDSDADGVEPGDSGEEDGDDDPEEGCMRCLCTRVFGVCVLKPLMIREMLVHRAPPRRWMTFEDALLPSPPSEDEQQQLTTRRADSHALAVVLDPHTKVCLRACVPGCGASLTPRTRHTCCCTYLSQIHRGISRPRRPRCAASRRSRLEK